MEIKSKWVIPWESSLCRLFYISFKNVCLYSRKFLLQLLQRGKKTRSSTQSTLRFYLTEGVCGSLRQLLHGGFNMSFREKIERAIKFCKTNKSYRIVLNHRDKQVILVRDCTNPVRIATVD